MEFVFLIIILKVVLAHADCNSLPVVPHAQSNVTIKGPYPTGTVTQFECDKGYNSKETSKIYICTGSSWTNGDLVCSERLCAHVPHPENGKIVNNQTRQIGSAIVFQCNTGYNMEGPDNMLCSTNATWSPDTPPTCQIVTCPEFGSIQNAQMEQGTSTVRNAYGAIVKLICDNGYVISGSPQVLCKADGNWGEKPECIKSQCPPYPGLNSSCIQKTKLANNDKYILMVCMDGDDESSTRIGPEESICENGRWDTNQGVMYCFCDCKITADLTRVTFHNVNTKGFLKHNQTLNWTCQAGWEKENTHKLICWDGHIETPQCRSMIYTRQTVVTNETSVSFSGSTVSAKTPPVTSQTLSSSTSKNTGNGCSDVHCRSKYLKILLLIILLVFANV